LFGAWAITLASVRNTSDVAIGTVFSGRNAPCSGVEDMVGMLINTMPVRVVIDDERPIDTWLSDLQRTLASTMAHSAARLSEIEAACGLPHGVFDTTFRFQNYPIDPSMLEGDSGLRIGGVAIRDVWHHPLNIAVIPGDDIQVVADYFPSTHSGDAIATALTLFIAAAAQLLNGGTESPAAFIDRWLPTAGARA
jgi:non-ribosomal peptide synthetase component F